MKQTLRSALCHAAAFLLLLFVEILIGSFAHGWLRSYGGDVLVLPLLYCLLRIFTKTLPRALPLCLFGFGCLTELLQWCDLAARLGFSEGSLPAVILGTRADWLDVLCYAGGTILLYAFLCIQACIERRSS